jgi:adenosylmethionine-8-amino-7-oxononanoate aminotransferase
MKRTGETIRTERRTEQLVEMDRRFVWHPFTQMRAWAETPPLVIERAEGSYIVDSEGRRYLDGVSSLWTNVHGHGRPELTAAIVEQLGRVAHTTLLGLANVPSIELAAALVEVAPPGLAKVFYSDSGSTAVEIALKMAFQYWQHRGASRRTRFVSLEDGYHGDTLGAVAVGGIDLFHGLFEPLLFAGWKVPTPHRCAGSAEARREAALAALDRVLAAHGDEIAAVIVEPLVQGAGGMLIQPSGYLAGVARLCRAHGVLLIADEVATGFGRTGTMFACEQEDVAPDLMCVAKGLTGGYLPLAATLATDAVYEAFLGTPAERRQFFHGHTYTGNPLACAAALASLRLFETDRVLERLRPKMERLRQRLGERVAPLAHVAEVRQKGLMVGIELVADRSTGRPFPADAQVGARVCERARGHGVILRPLGDVVVLMPPLSIELEEIDVLVDATARAIAGTGADVAGPRRESGPR